MMGEAKLAPNLPDWIVKHANRYIASGGADGHLYKINVPGRGEITAPALLLTTPGRKSGDKFILPLFYGTDGDSYFVVASKGGAPEHPGWYRNILAKSRRRGTGWDEEAKGAGEDCNRRRTHSALEKGARILAALCRLSAQDRTRDPGGRAGP
jgi:deazaflavin-dependent oxidoreductase (nitroreductase family)